VHLTHEEHVQACAARDGLLDRPREQPVLQAADNEQVGVMLIGDLEQSLGWRTDLCDVPGLDLPPAERHPCLLGLRLGKFLRLRPLRLRLRRHRAWGGIAPFVADDDRVHTWLKPNQVGMTRCELARPIEDARGSVAQIAARSFA
jgi:hypothetical protein